MYEFLWHGRGGQGAFTAARLLGTAFALNKDGNNALAFPSFGPERRGAPIRAFTKLSDKKIGDRSELKKADYVIYLDDTLFDDSAFDELKEGGKIILCTKKIITDKRVVCLDGVTLAEKILKLPITNTVILGAIAAIFDEITLEDLNKAVELSMAPRLVAKNQQIILEAYENVKGAL